MQRPLRSDRLEEREAQRVEMLFLVVPSQGVEPRPTTGAGCSGPPMVWRRLMWLCPPSRFHRVDSVSPAGWLLPLLVLLFSVMATCLASSFHPMSTGNHHSANPGNQFYLVAHLEAVQAVCLSHILALPLSRSPHLRTPSCLHISSPGQLCGLNADSTLRRSTVFDCVHVVEP